MKSKNDEALANIDNDKSFPNKRGKQKLSVKLK